MCISVIHALYKCTYSSTVKLTLINKIQKLKIKVLQVYDGLMGVVCRLIKPSFIGYGEEKSIWKVSQLVVSIELRGDVIALVLYGRILRQLACFERGSGQWSPPTKIKIPYKSILLN